MLVLSRRPSEKILFPSVGITVEIVQTKGNTVRVGIEAPEDIRVLRGELQPHVLDDISTEMNHVSISEQSDSDQFDDVQQANLRSRIDEIGLALALAQNQQRQGLSDNVDAALEEAMDRLDELKRIFEPAKTESSAVYEPKAGYTTRKLATKLEFRGGSERNFCLEFEFAI